MTEIFILGVDGIDQRFVDRFNLENVKQEEYGQVEVPLDSNMGKPTSPTVWGAFLTGKNKERRFSNNSLSLEVLKKIWRYLPDFGLGNYLEKKRILPQFSSSVVDFPELGEDEITFLDEAESVHINSPFYDYDLKPLNRKERSYLQDEIPRSEFKDFIIDNYEENKQRVIEAAEKDTDIFFAYFHFFDALQHHFYMDEELIEKYYRDLDEFVGKLKDKVDTGLFLVVSDHGLKDGDHTDLGFYSSDEELGLDMPHITDFYDIFMGRLGLPTSREKEDIRENLEKLGYMD